MSGLSLTDSVKRWAEDAAADASHGAVCEENIVALRGRSSTAELGWRGAQVAFEALIAHLAQSEISLVLKLIVPLRSHPQLMTTPPDLSQVEQDVDEVTPPSLVVHSPVFRRDWDTVEEYRCPLPRTVFLDADASPMAFGMYIAFRSQWEMQDGAAYRRQLLFERVQD